MASMYVLIPSANGFQWSINSSLFLSFSFFLVLIQGANCWWTVSLGLRIGPTPVSEILELYRRLDVCSVVAGGNCFRRFSVRDYHPGTDIRTKPGLQRRSVAGHVACVCQYSGHLRFQRIFIRVDASATKSDDGDAHLLLGSHSDRALDIVSQTTRISRLYPIHQ